MSTVPFIGHKAISASAGSGKTFQLAHRYIRLLMAGVEPDRIVALTFSRKAAGEIFDSIMTYLCAAAADPAAATATSGHIGIDGGCESYLQTLRRVIRSLHRLRIGTLDGFTVGVVRAFPMEVGVAPGFEVMDSDGAAAALARAEVLHELFDPRRMDSRDQDEFIEAFKQSTFGREEKRLLQALDAFVVENQAVFRRLSDPAAWGGVARIWPAGSRWLTDPGALTVAVAACREQIDAQTWSDAVKRKWLESLETMAAHQPGSPWDAVKYLPERLLPELNAMTRGALTIKIVRTLCEGPPELCRNVLALLTHVMAVEVVTAVEQTRGMGRVLQQFETLYDALVRRRGRLTFDDAQLLLTEHNPASGGKVISCGPDRAGRLQIDYRLDGRLDHWLIDEFQDTSDLQWDVLRNLIDEVVQDPEQQRSFFYVGDVKQAIYGWRGGNPRLFREILDRYAGAIEEEPLDRSYRSCPAVIDTVNRVFDDLPADRLTPGAVDLWTRIWSPHSCAEGFVPATGFAGLLEVESSGGGRSTAGDRFDVAARLVRELDPVRRGLSTALLVRTNDAGRELVDALRAYCPAIPVVHEGRAYILDNPVVAVLLSLVKAAAHPGDSLAWQHLRMSPLRSWLDRRRVDGDDLTRQVLAQLHDTGFREVLAVWGERLEAACPLDGFGRKRLRELLAAAGEFDDLGSRDVNEFIAFIDAYSVREPATSRAVRVMTIHQSKGLGFDVVILPDLEGASLKGGGALGLAVERDPDWVLRLPRRLVAQHDEVLAEQLRKHDEADCFESLCVLYVALTRAKQGLYMISGRGGVAGSDTLYPVELLKQRLATGDGDTIVLDGRDVNGLYAEGDPGWYRKIALPVETPEPPPELDHHLSGRPSRRTALIRVAPSGLDVREENAGELFAPRRQEIFDYGTAMHHLFEQIAWIDESDPEQVLADWCKTDSAPDPMRASIAAAFCRAIADPAIHNALARPDPAAILWREKAFEIVLDNEWVSGTFDRVTLVPGGAHILDYKTNRITTDNEIAAAAQHYRGQLELYQCALAAILSLDPESIRLHLLFTTPGRLVELR